MDFAVPAVLIIDLEINPKTDTVFKIGAYRPTLTSGLNEASAMKKVSGRHWRKCSPLRKVQNG